jgi:hypothetical protein
MDDNDNDFVPVALQPWIDKVENALYFSDIKKRLTECKEWDWEKRYWTLLENFYGFMNCLPTKESTVQLLVNDVLGPGHLPVPEEGFRGYTWYEYCNALVESLGLIGHPWHMGKRISHAHYTVFGDDDDAVADEFAAYNCRCTEMLTPLVELLYEAGNFFGYWNAHTKKFTDGCAFPSYLTPMQVLKFLEQKAGFEPIPIPIKYEDQDDTPFWGRVKRLEKRWSYNLECIDNLYQIVPGENDDWNIPYKTEPKVPIVKRLSMMLALQEFLWADVEKAMNIPHLQSDTDDSAEENENDNAAIEDV